MYATPFPVGTCVPASDLPTVTVDVDGPVITIWLKSNLIYKSENLSFDNEFQNTVKLSYFILKLSLESTTLPDKYQRSTDRFQCYMLLRRYKMQKFKMILHFKTQT